MEILIMLLGIDIPELPRDRYLLIQRLEKSIMRVSGVDDRYTGRNSSVQTTGGWTS